MVLPSLLEVLSGFKCFIICAISCLSFSPMDILRSVKCFSNCGIEVGLTERICLIISGQIDDDSLTFLDFGPSSTGIPCCFWIIAAGFEISSALRFLPLFLGDNLLLAFDVRWFGRSFLSDFSPDSFNSSSSPAEEFSLSGELFTPWLSSERLRSSSALLLSLSFDFSCWSWSSFSLKISSRDYALKMQYK